MQRQLVRKQMRNVILILVLLLMILEWICYVRQMRYRGRFYLAVRLVGLALLVLAVCGISVPLSHAKDTTVFWLICRRAMPQISRRWSSI